MALPLRDQKHQYLKYEGLQYTDADITDFKTRLGKIYRRESTRMLKDKVYSLAELGGGYLRLEACWRRMSWIDFILAMGLHIAEEIYSVGFYAYWAESARKIPNKGDLSAYWVGSHQQGIFLVHPSYTLIRDLMLRLCHRLITCSIVGRSQAVKKVTVTALFYLRGMDVGSVNVPYMLACYLRLFASGGKQGVMIFRGQFVARLVRLQIYVELDDTWAWVASGPERQQVAMTGALEAAKDAPVADEGASAVPALVQAPQPSPPTAGLAKTMAQRLARVEEDVHEIRGALGEQREVLNSMACNFSQFSTWTVVGLSQMMSQAGVRYISYADFHIPYMRCSRRRTDDVSTSTA
nr:hypothetical protein [Tanacetum cinerariifolium]